MKKAWKSYGALTSPGYRIWGLLVIPALLLVALGGCLSIPQSPTGRFCVYIIAMYFVSFEVFRDYWLFGGICQKQTPRLEYVKTSRWGMKLLLGGAVMDLIQRWGYAMIFAALCIVRTKSWSYLMIGLLIYIAEVLLLNVTRYAPTMQIQLLLSICAAVVLLVFLDIWDGGTISYGSVSVMVLLELLLSIFTVWHIKYRVKGSYYEK
jgi:hypothetical protein